MRVQTQRAGNGRQPDAGAFERRARRSAAVAAAHALAAGFAAARTQDGLRIDGARAASDAGQHVQRRAPHAIDAGNIQPAVDDAETPAVVARQSIGARDDTELAVDQDAEARVECRHADRAIAQRSDRADEAAVERRRPRRRFHHVVANLAQAGFGADQQRRVVEAIQRSHARARAAGRRSDQREAAAAIAIQAAGRADPEIVRAVLRDRVDLVRVERLQRRGTLELLIGVNRHAAARADPDAVAIVDEQFVRGGIRQQFSGDEFVHAVRVDEHSRSELVPMSMRPR